MSLQVWLPLNGNLDNLGLNGAVFTNTGVAVSNTGKIGKSFSFDASHYITSDTANFLPDSTEVSICCWIKDTAAVGSWHRIGGLNSHTYLHLDINTTGQARFFLTPTGSAGSTASSPISTTVVQDGTWHHVCGTADATTVSIYVDGKLEATKPREAIYSTSSSKLMIATITNGALFKGEINDFRLYNHCLSQKEINEIYKTLVLHYRFSGYGIHNYFKGSYGSSWSNAGWMWNSTNMCFEIGKIYLKGFSVGDVMNCSLDYKYSGFTASSSGTPGFYVQGSGNVTGWNAGTHFSKSPTYNLTGNGTIHMSWSFTLTSEQLKNEYFIISIRHDYLSSGYFQWRKFKAEKSNETSWNPSSYDLPDIEFDCSGYGYNGIIHKNNILWNADTPRNTTSYYFTSQSYIGLDKIPLNDANSNFTFSFWMKTSNPGNTMALWNGRTNVGGSFSIFALGGQFRYDDGSQHTIAYTIPKDQWHHYVFTRDAFNIKLYVDGELQITTPSTKLSGMGTKATIGTSSVNTSTGNGSNNFTGSLSDYRIYATTLSAEDVLELYHTSVMVDNVGNAYAFEYIEEE